MFEAWLVLIPEKPIVCFIVEWEVTEDQSNERAIAFLAASAAWLREGSAVGGANQEKREAKEGAGNWLSVAETVKRSHFVDVCSHWKTCQAQLPYCLKPSSCLKCLIFIWNFKVCGGLFSNNRESVLSGNSLSII